MEDQRKSLGPVGRKSKGRSRQPSVGAVPAAAQTPATVVRDDAETQTRRILKVRRRIDDGNFEYKPTSPTTTGMKRRLFGSPGDAAPVSPGLGGDRTKLRRIMESPIRSRKSSVPGTGRKSRATRHSGRPSAAPSRMSGAAQGRRSGAAPPGLGLEGMTVRQLKNLLTAAGVDTADCVEKQDMIEKATKLGLQPASGRPSVSAKSTPVIEPVQLPAPTVAKRHSRKHSGGKVSATALMEIARIEEVVAKHGASCFDILGVSRLGSTEASIRSRSKQLFRHVHPDKIHEEAVKRRAHNVFQLINEAVEEALKLLATSAARDPPKPPMGIKYTVERAGTVVLLRWKPDSSAESFRVFACLPGLHRAAIDQGTVANMPGDNGELEYAISTQSRAGNDELFQRGKFEVAISAVNAAGESPSMTVCVDISRPSSLGGLKRHHTIC